MSASDAALDPRSNARHDLLAQPHHDGSALYVSNPHPALGETVTVRVRVPKEADVTAVHVRLTPDAEPFFVDAVIERETASDTWWVADIVVHNPVTNYRFILEGGPTAYQWLNGTGVHHRDVPDAADFRLTAFGAPPAWASGAVVYQIFPDRFGRSAGQDEREVPDWAVPRGWDEPVLLEQDVIATQLYGGDLDGIVEHLDHLERLGVNVVYLTPFFPARSNHRYDASSFDHVDPVLGGDEALARLVDACHARGMRVLGDFTTNHTGDAHQWFVTAQQDPESEEHGYYFWEDGDYVAWLGVKSLPKLNYDSDALRHRVFEDEAGVVRRWITGDSPLDGWRVDVANMTGRYRGQDRNAEIARQMRLAMEEAAPDALLVGEHCHDYTQDAQGDGWHGVMNYAGFTRPVWTWLRARGHAPKFLGSPLMVPRLGGHSVMETMREFTAMVPWSTVRHSFNLVGSHDTTRIRTLVDDVRHVEVAAGLLFTLPGIPMFTYGDEIGMEGEFGEDGRRPMPWDEQHWDAALLGAYRGLIAARNESVALREGGMRWVHADDDALVFLRESPTEVALVHCARHAHDAVHITTSRLPGIEAGVARYGDAPVFGEGRMSLQADGPQVSVWTWQVSE
ncbi:glycoside hydrolase family 13 protein [Knoellia sp. p5-6-4]|uniref:glycoside hydrolase family 13 protein n=1 Tax=unclassified Knoellia TaxID=2618719 RepID=UPI0023DC1D6C|nr:glycoside hydrolase family 13 protein [Knoellia sp. p5-6-4]MDF2145475.1 glycoside hydrolase family 13 protein [Knoellia sp. p5-6-4]